MPNLRVHANIIHTLEEKQTNRTSQIRITEQPKCLDVPVKDRMKTQKKEER